MRVLIAEDDAVSRHLLQSLLTRWGYEVTAVENGAEALEILAGGEPPPLVVLDRMMPRLDGVEVCRQVRALPDRPPLYILLLTVQKRTDEIVEGLEAGADDYLTKPFDSKELRARVGVGERVMRLQNELNQRLRELEEALAQVNKLEGLLPICSYCKRVRDDQDYWQQVEAYVEARSEARFSHGICPDCYEEHFRPKLEELKRKQEREKSQN